MLLMPAMLASCSLLGLTATPRPSVPAFAVQVDTDFGLVGVVRKPDSLSVFAVSNDGAVSELTSTTDAGGSEPSLHLYSRGGETGVIDNTFVYGYAPNGAAAVSVSPGNVRVDVTQGMFIAALEAKDVVPTELFWTFFDAAGSVMMRGNGIRG